MNLASGHDRNRARLRLTYAAAAGATIALGLVLRAILPPASVARDVAGNALWAAMMLWWVSALAPDARLLVRGAVALGISFAVELSQLYHTPALDALRSTTGGHLVLGSGFDPRDFVAYGLGVVVAALLERSVRGRVPRPSIEER